jgi:hypothetical protein
MRILKLTLGKNIFLQISLKFHIFSVKRPYACSETNFREKYFSANFSQVSDFQCEVSGWTYSYVRMRAVLPYADLAIVIRTVK